MRNLTMRILSGALLIGELALIAPQASAQYLGVPYYGQPPFGQPPPSHSTQQTPTYGTRHVARHHHHGKPSEDAVIVTAHAPERSAAGTQGNAPSLSREVAIGDLDLRTRRGMHQLRSRVSFTADALCSRLSAPRDSDCSKYATRDAMAQAHDAIHDARGYGGY